MRDLLVSPVELSYLIDGNGGSYGSDVYSYNPFWFVIDMKSAQTFNALGMDYYYTYASKKVRISTSLDNETGLHRECWKFLVWVIIIPILLFYNSSLCKG